MKRILKIFILFIGVILVCGTTVYADEKEYNIESVDFEVHLDENGDAYVTEKWNLNFIKGDFTRFYISRLINTNELENFNNIEFNTFSINGEICEITENYSERPKGRYYVDYGEDEIQYEWYIRANNTKMTFENSYKLTDVVKYNDNGYAFFCYRFIGSNLDKEIKKLNIRIYSPSACNIEVRNNSGLDSIINEDYVELSEENSFGLVKINVAMDKDVFLPDISYIGQETIDKITLNKETIEDTEKYYYTYDFMIFVVIIGIIILYGVISLKKVKKLSMDNGYISNVINELKTNNISPFELSRIYRIRRLSMNEFKLIFLDLLRRGIISISSKKIYINRGLEDNLKNYEIRLLRILEDYSINNKEYVPMNDFIKMLKDDSAIFYIGNLYDDKEAKKYRRAHKKELKVLKYYFTYVSRGYTTNIIEILEKYEKFNYIELENLYYMSCMTLYTKQKEEEYYSSKDDNNDYYMAFYYMDYHSHYYINSNSSGCSSCSSCSSCSGCGGGGAD